MKVSGSITEHSRRQRRDALCPVEPHGNHPLMMTRLVLRIGDMLVCLMRHPPVFIASTFAFLWSGWTLGLHFVPRNFYNDATAEVQADSGDRLLAMPVIARWDIDACVSEAERCAPKWVTRA